MTSDTPSLAAVQQALDNRYPQRIAEDWDHVGLVTGDPDQPIHKVLFAVDPFPSVAQEAIDWGADLIVAHHPLLFHAIHAATDATGAGRTLRRLIRNDIALYTAHTTADSATQGVNDALADVLGMVESRQPIRPIPDLDLVKVTLHVPNGAARDWIDQLASVGAGATPGYDRCGYWEESRGQYRPLAGSSPGDVVVGEVTTTDEQRVEMVAVRDRLPAVRALIAERHPYEVPAVDVVDLVPAPGCRGIGRWGEVVGAPTLAELAQRLVQALPSTAHGVRVAGDPELPVEQAAVCGGSGDSLLADVARLPVSAFVTSDLRHNPASDFRNDGGCALVDISHYAGEHLWLDRAAELLRGDFASLATHVSQLNTDPWTFRL